MAKAFNPKSVGVWFPRVVKIELRPFTKYFKGFEKVEAVRKTFGAQTDRVLRSLKVEFFSSKWGYMGVSDEDGHLVVSAYYLRTGNLRDIYLDVVHELVHVKQFRDGRKLFPEGFEYSTAPTEIEAYKVCIAEGRRLGMTDKRVLEYLKVPWMDDREWRRLARNLGLRPPAPRRKR
ncbi:MAG: hypothetical protein E6K17_03110 [Methanobacteriota archaeon]|nr:MAG: hypothetical protein E6K17_03110 [Euryarchaeota archaeon]